MHTSEGSRGYGWTYLPDIAIGIRRYADYKGYDDWYVYNGGLSFARLIDEIDAGRPMVGYVAVDGNVPNHFISIIGYDDENMMYAFYNSWSEDEIICWAEFHGVDGDPWGVRSATFIRPGEPDLQPVPEPASFLLFSVGLLAMTGINRKSS